jgi:hypothetical protein
MRWGLAVAALVCALSPAGAHAAGRTSRKPESVSPADAAATHAYLVATNSYEETELANLPQEIAAQEATAARITGECPGILTGAPPHEEVLGFGLVAPGPVGPVSGTRPSARAEGERRRQSRQLGDLKTELLFALSESSTQQDREASTTLISALTPLKWSNPFLVLLVQATVAGNKEVLELPTLSVCADMRSWVASGYKTLTTTSREIASRSEAIFKRSFELIAIAARLDKRTLLKIFAPYENASDRALARHAEALELRLHKRQRGDGLKGVLKRLEATVGLAAEKAPKVKRTKSKPAVVIARGKTAAGGSFVAKAERSSLGCDVFVSITEPSRPSLGLLETLSGEGTGTGRCLSRSHVTVEPAVHCASGLLTIEANLLAKTRSVRLLLSDGQTITSPAIRVPARLGGPAGLYYQAVRGPIPIPVSLTELDASGATVAVLKLAPVVECTKHVVKHFPGGNVLLVHESPPQIPAFTIRGEHFRKLGTEHFELKFRISNEEHLFGGGGEGAGGFAGSLSMPEGSGRALEPMASSGCQPQPYAIIYGLLEAPHDTVLARVSGDLVPLRTVTIPAREHAGGVLVYGAFSPLPTELIIRNASGKTVNTTNLTEAAKSETESCEGEAEGS